MSEALFANLPRFDRLNGGANAAAASLRKVAAPDPAPAEPVEEAEPDGDALAREALNRQLQALEATLGSLTETIEQTRAEAETQTMETIVAMAETLFPALSKDFLAEEIARHLPELLPKTAATVEIRAESALAESLREIIARSERLSAICTVHEDEAPGGDRVSVSWGAGGLDFDFAGLLESCLGQLRSRNPVTEG
ncbi:hypothetical protein [Henriciella aquimarina]|uniref:hypothetical protein n=1 Tax=Henriciella aquimarina TaxID=545261 RepID=UPI000A00AD83|nr:hypothetical protein [Henriciella aquimarina]